jgi:hypothetical protein
MQVNLPKEPLEDINLFVKYKSFSNLTNIIILAL